MEASTIVASIASELGASWTGYTDRERASVVLLWPGEKVYLNIQPDQPPDIQGAKQRLVAVQEALKSRTNP